MWLVERTSPKARSETNSLFSSDLLLKVPPCGTVVPIASLLNQQEIFFCRRHLGAKRQRAYGLKGIAYLIF